MNRDRECADHFVGAETLTCVTCGWNAATNSYNDTHAWCTCTTDYDDRRTDGTDCPLHGLDVAEIDNSPATVAARLDMFRGLGWRR
jgi:hypothetical protein